MTTEDQNAREARRIVGLPPDVEPWPWYRLAWFSFIAISSDLRMKLLGPIVCRVRGRHDWYSLHDIETGELAEDFAVCHRCGVSAPLDR